MTNNLYAITGLLNGQLYTAARPRGGAWLERDLRGWRAAGVHVVLSALTGLETQELELEAEADLWMGLGGEFLRHPIPDFSLPASALALRPVMDQLLARLEEGHSLLIHCRGGIGRSSLLAASLLVCVGVAPEAAWARIAEARGCQVPDTEAQRRWVFDFAEVQRRWG